MRRLFFGVLVVCLGVVISSCKEEGPHLNPLVSLKAAIGNGDLNSSANAVGVFEYHRIDKRLRYNITYQRINPSVIQIFSEEIKGGTMKAEMILPKPETNPVVGTIYLDERLHTLLLKGQLSIAFPSPDYPQGEIRGYIVLDY